MRQLIDPSKLVNDEILLPAFELQSPRLTVRIDSSHPKTDITFAMCPYASRSTFFRCMFLTCALLLSWPLVSGQRKAAKPFSSNATSSHPRLHGTSPRSHHNTISTVHRTAEPFPPTSNRPAFRPSSELAIVSTPNIEFSSGQGLTRASLFSSLPADSTSALLSVRENVQDMDKNHQCNQPRARLFKVKELNADFRHLIPK